MEIKFTDLIKLKQKVDTIILNPKLEYITLADFWFYIDLVRKDNTIIYLIADDKNFLKLGNSNFREFKFDIYWINKEKHIAVFSKNYIKKISTFEGSIKDFINKFAKGIVLSDFKIKNGIYIKNY